MSMSIPAVVSLSPWQWMTSSQLLLHTSATKYLIKETVILSKTAIKIETGASFYSSDNCRAPPLFFLDAQ